MNEQGTIATVLARLDFQDKRIAALESLVVRSAALARGMADLIRQEVEQT